MYVHVSIYICAYIDRLSMWVDRIHRFPVRIYLSAFPETHTASIHLPSLPLDSLSLPRTFAISVPGVRRDLSTPYLIYLTSGRAIIILLQRPSPIARISHALFTSLFPPIASLSLSLSTLYALFITIIIVSSPRDNTLLRVA